MAKRVRNQNRTCMGYNSVDLRKYQGTAGPGDRRAMPQDVVASISTLINDTNTAQWSNKRLFITTCGSLVTASAVVADNATLTCATCLANVDN